MKIKKTLFEIFVISLVLGIGTHVQADGTVDEVEAYKKDLIELAQDNINVVNEVEILESLLSQEQIAKAIEEIQPPNTERLSTAGSPSHAAFAV